MKTSIPHPLNHGRLLIRRPKARAVATIVCLRSVFLFILIAALNHFVPLGTSVAGLVLSASLGVLCATLLAFAGVNSLGLAIGSLTVITAYSLLFQFLGLLPIEPASNPFLIYSWREHGNLILVSGFFGLLSTWAFWRFRFVLTLEFIALGILGLTVFTGHRNLRLDKPQIITDLSWSMGVEPLTMVVLLGAGLLLLLIAYLFCSTAPSKPDPRHNAPELMLHKQRVDRRTGLIMLAVFASAIGLILQGTYSHFDTVLRENPPEGVGMAEKNSEGVSPLDFSGQGTGNNQPSALVRLEGDYTGNPFSPMLYLRESALSSFNGHEMVLAGREFDTDVSTTSPDEAYAINPEPIFVDPLRRKLTQSVFLLANHKLAFGIDFPYLIRPLKNPDPKRFKQAYRAYSYVPSFSREELLGYETGDTSWPEAVRAHYLKTSPDARYSQLATQITAGITDPVQQAFVVTDYLSKKSIYTLTPNHDVPKDADPVAPYLFGDFRGYCVHFAHATTYMLRSLGIPARIGTGYMTDLSQAKDGHILLRMSDRHAWAEVYVRGIGWVPFDTQPLQVENHADTPVDMKVLEELMGLIDPGEELLGKDLLKDEANIEEPQPFHLPKASTLLIPAGLTLMTLLIVKAFLLFGYRLTSDPQTHLRRSYRALITMLYDLGIRRNRGETRQEFRTRVADILGVETLSLTDPLIHVAYADSSQQHPSMQSILHSFEGDRMALNSIPRWRRVVAFLNPASAIAIPLGGRW